MNLHHIGWIFEYFMHPPHEHYTCRVLFQIISTEERKKLQSCGFLHVKREQVFYIFKKELVFDSYFLFKYFSWNVF